MRRLSGLLVVVVLVTATTVATASAGASTAAHAARFVGRYRVTSWFPPDPGTSTDMFAVHADGTVTDGHGHTAKWSNSGDVLTFVVSIDTRTAVWRGVRTIRGISRPKQPGTVTSDGTVTGYWYARQISANP